MMDLSHLTAVVLCGGKGSRLAPWDAPKCLIPIKGVPMIHRIIDRLRKSGVGRIVLAVGYKAEDVVNGTQDKEVYYSNAGEDVGMTQRLWEAWREHASPESRLLACYGDELADVNIELLATAHLRAKVGMTVTLFHHRLPFGVVRTPGGLIEHDVDVAVNIGYSIIEPSVWQYDEIHQVEGLAGMYNAMHKRSPANVAEYHHLGKRATVNSLPELQAAEEEFA